mgnify:CR=1 FL=1
MSELAKTVGQRIRNYRTKLGLSQEKLAELSGCHPTYIGQLERGEKNATIESIEKSLFNFFKLNRLFLVFLYLYYFLNIHKLKNLYIHPL